MLDQLQARTSRKRSARLSDGSCSTCTTAAAEDMTAASDAVRKVYDPQWHDKLTRFLSQARRSESDDDGEQDEISGDEGAPAIEGS